MKPKYQLIADQLRNDILNGVYLKGEAIPTEKELQEHYNVSRQTIRQAIALLNEDDFLERRRGSGTYIKKNFAIDNNNMQVSVITTSISDSIFPSVVQGIESVLSSENYTMNLSSTYNRLDKERTLLERILQSPVSGLIVEGSKTALPNPNIDLYEKLIKKNIPVVFINGSYPQLSGYTSIITDDLTGGKLATQVLIDKGLKRIAGIFQSDDIRGHLRYRGYIEAMNEANLPTSDSLVFWFSNDSSKDEINTNTLLENIIGKADGLICYNDEMALNILNMANELNLDLPKELSLISFNNVTATKFCQPKLTTLSHPKTAFGQAAARTLLRMMKGKKVEDTVFPWKLIERDSIIVQN